MLQGAGMTTQYSDKIIKNIPTSGEIVLGQNNLKILLDTQLEYLAHQLGLKDRVKMRSLLY